MSEANVDSSCAVKPVIAHRPQAVGVNGIAISRAAISREAQNHPAAKPIEAWQAAARALAIRELLLQEARRLQLEPEPETDDEGRRETDEEAIVRQLVAREVRTPQADEAACRRFYGQNRDRFRSADLHEARHILLPAAPGDIAMRTEARSHAGLIILQLQQEPSSFAAIASAVSACPSAKVGGSLGQIGPGQTAPEFEQALASAPIGMVAPQPVETRYGLHVLAVDRRIEGRNLPFEAVHPRIAAWLDEKVRRTAIRQYISLLAGRAEITGVALDGASSPLMQ